MISENPGPLPEKKARWRSDVQLELIEIERLEEGIAALDIAFSGLQDLDMQFSLIKIKLATAHTLLVHPDNYEIEEKLKLARRQAGDAVSLFESLLSMNVSLDQRARLHESSEVADIREQIYILLRAGGLILFEADDSETRREEDLANVVCKSLMKFAAVDPRDAVEESLEIAPGEEDVLMADRMMLPISQAIHLIEEEILPGLHSQLEKNPGDPDLQQRIVLLQDQLDFFRHLKFFPRTRPARLDEKDLFTQSLTSFTQDGELLVALEIPTIQNSGNKYDLLLDSIKAQIVHDCAGDGVSPDLDDKLKETKSVNSGQRGSLTEPVSKIQVHKAFRSMCLQYPFLRRLEDKEQLKQLADLAEQKERPLLLSEIKTMAGNDRNYLIALARKQIERQDA